MGLAGASLPDFPWDSLAPAHRRARQYPGGIIDLSIGTPVDDAPEVAQQALRDAANTPGYPATIGTPELREAIVHWWRRRRQVTHVGIDQVLPTIGSKEIVALLPAFLGLGPGDVVVHPATAYPTYDVGARLAGARPYPSDMCPDSWPDNTRLVWVNSPGNPHGHVMSVPQLRTIVAAARERGIIVASDECYAELPMTDELVRTGVPSILADDVCDANSHGLLALYSLSKQSNLAGYRAAFVAGDSRLIAALTAIRKHAGFLVPAPVQAAMSAVLTHDEHVAYQRQRYRRRREVLAPALARFGLAVDPQCRAGLYLWARRPEREASAAASADLVVELADRGILVAPGTFYGQAGCGYVRIALSASDADVSAACDRLA